MDKRTAENLRAKRAITKAFLALLKEQDLERISISEITRAAQVSRMAYYRNFTSKTDILDFYLDDIGEELMAHMGHDVDFWTNEYGSTYFQTMKSHKNEILLLHELGFSGMIIHKFTIANEQIAGDMPRSSIERYRLYYVAGAAYAGTIEWLKGGCLESVADMTRSLGAFMGIDNEGHGDAVHGERLAAVDDRHQAGGRMRPTKSP